MSIEKCVFDPNCRCWHIFCSKLFLLFIKKLLTILFIDGIFNYVRGKNPHGAGPIPAREHS